nr:MAG TPA: hypothetical protein [Caudoviricetes sp.]
MRCRHSGYGSAKQDNRAGNRPLFLLHDIKIIYNKQLEKVLTNQR